MNTKIPFTKDITFEKKVSEITSISLEHEIKVEDSVLKGNFIISGDYKSHEVSVNKEPFSYMLPFEIELSHDIDTETIEFCENTRYNVTQITAMRLPQNDRCSRAGIFSEDRGGHDAVTIRSRI